MKLDHYVAFNPSIEQAAQLQQFGMSIEAKQWCGFAIHSEDPSWPSIRQLLSDWGIESRVVIEYSENERRRSPYLQVRSGKGGIYPEPREDNGWESATYDLSRYCSACGSRAKPVHPFQMSTEPEFGRSDVVSFLWVYDELFVRSQIWKRVFEPFGIESLPVISHRTGLPLDTVVQPSINDISRFPLDARDKWESFVCSACGQKKNCGSQPTPFFPHFAGNPEGHVFKTQELFGAGSISARAVVCSNELYRAIVSAGVRGFQFEPQEPV